MNELLLPVLMMVTFVGCSNAGPALETIDAASDPDGGTASDGGPTSVACQDRDYGVALFGQPPSWDTWNVQTRGALAYDLRTDVATDVVGTLTAVDTLASSFVLTTNEGDVEVFARPVPEAMLEALPIGREVVAHFALGVRLHDAADDSLLLAVVAERDFGVPRFEVGPVVVEGAAPFCLTLILSPPCVFGSDQTDVTFSLGATSLTLGPSSRPQPLVDGDDAFQVLLVGSARQRIPEAALVPPGYAACAPALTGQIVVVVGRDAG